MAYCIIISFLILLGTIIVVGVINDFIEGSKPEKKEKSFDDLSKEELCYLGEFPKLPCSPDEVKQDIEYNEMLKKTRR